MENKNSSTLSVIALIISIIALLISLFLAWCCPCWRSCCHKHQAADGDQPTVVSAQPSAASEQEADFSDQQPVAQPIAEDPNPSPMVNPDGATKKKAATAPFIDLGLPSGTKWRIINEDALMTYDEAIEKFDKQLPSYKQFKELYDKCEWKELKDGGYKVVGPNGNHIIFPFTGFINCTGEFRMGNELGDYWTSTKKGEKDAYRVAMNARGVVFQEHPCCYARGIRLVEK